MSKVLHVDLSDFMAFIKVNFPSYADETFCICFLTKNTLTLLHSQ